MGGPGGSAERPWISSTRNGPLSRRKWLLAGRSYQRHQNPTPSLSSCGPGANMPTCQHESSKNTRATKHTIERNDVRRMSNFLRPSKQQAVPPPLGVSPCRNEQLSMQWTKSNLCTQLLQLLADWRNTAPKADMWNILKNEASQIWIIPWDIWGLQASAVPWSCQQIWKDYYTIDAQNEYRTYWNILKYIEIQMQWMQCASSVSPGGRWDSLSNAPGQWHWAPCVSGGQIRERMPRRTNRTRWFNMIHWSFMLFHHDCCTLLVCGKRTGYWKG